MGVNQFTESASFGPREIAEMAAAYEQALAQLGIDRRDPRAEAVALRILQTAVKDPHALAESPKTDGSKNAKPIEFK